MTITDFAVKINRERTTARDILKRKSIDIELLMKISKILDYDFITNVYYEKQTSQTLFISIKTEEEILKNLNLLEEFIHFMKSKKENGEIFPENGEKIPDKK